MTKWDFDYDHDYEHEHEHEDAARCFWAHEADILLMSGAGSGMFV